MGRSSTGVWTTGEATQLSLAFLKKHGYLKPGIVRSGLVSWSRNDEPSGSINVASDTTNPRPVFTFSYTITDRYSDEKTHMKYDVTLVCIPSNLGKGYRYYFLCPVSGKRCTILYLAYGSHYFKCREAYQNRLYYDGQKEGKKYRSLKFFFIDRRIEELYEKRVKYHYRGKPTRLTKRIESLELKCNYWSAVAYRNMETMFGKK